MYLHVVHMMLALGCFIEDQQNGIKIIVKLHLNFHTPAISQKMLPIFIFSKPIISSEVIGLLKIRLRLQNGLGPIIP